MEDELGPGVKSEDVIYETDSIYDNHAYKEKAGPQAYRYLSVCTNGVENGHGKKECRNHAWQETDAPEAWDACLVYLPHAGQIIQFAFFAETVYDGNEYDPAYKTYKK